MESDKPVVTDRLASICFGMLQLFSKKARRFEQHTASTVAGKLSSFSAVSPGFLLALLCTLYC